METSNLMEGGFLFQEVSCFRRILEGKHCAVTFRQVAAMFCTVKALSILYWFCSSFGPNMMTLKIKAYLHLPVWCVWVVSGKKKTCGWANGEQHSQVDVSKLNQALFVCTRGGLWSKFKFHSSFQIFTALTHRDQAVRVKMATMREHILSAVLYLFTMKSSEA